MSDATYDRPLAGPEQSGGGKIPTTVAKRLSALRQKLIAWLVVDGLSRVLWLVIALALIDFGLDYLFQMDFAQRSVMLVLIVGAIIAASVWRLIRPLRRIPGDDALVLEVEEHNKQLGQSLISAVQFSRMGDITHQGISMRMVQATIDAGAEAAEDVDFGATLNAKKMYINAGLVALACLVLAGAAYGVAQSNSLAIWFNRNVMLGDRMWPQDINIEIIDTQASGQRLVRGEDWTQYVGVTKSSKAMPDQVFVDFRSAGSQPSKEMQEINTNESDFQEHGAMFEPYAKVYKIVVKNVFDEFEFRGRAFDRSKIWNAEATTVWRQVDLVDQPTMASLTLEVKLPDYAGGKVESLPPGKGPYYILKGSSLRLSGTANKPLLKAELRIGGEDSREPSREAATVSEPANAPSWELAISDSVQVTGSVPSAELQPGTYQILLRDTDEVESTRPTTFTLNIRPDRIPRVRTMLHGISGMVISRAMIPTTTKATDDFAITRINVDYKWRGAVTEPANGAGSIKFGGPDEVLQQTAYASVSLMPHLCFPLVSHPALAVAGTTHQFGVDPETHFAFGEFNYYRVFDLRSVVLPPGMTEIPPDVTLTFEVVAYDNDTLSGPNRGVSTEFLVQVVTEEKLRTDLLRREKEQRQEFERLLKNQEDLYTDMNALAAKTREGGVFDKLQREDIRNAARKQKVIGTNIAEISQRLQLLLIEAENNRLEEGDSPFHRRLQYGVINPMQSLAERRDPEAEADTRPNIPRAEGGLHNVRQLDMDEAFTNRALKFEEVVDEQKRIVDQMHEIREQMVKSESFQEAVQLLHELETLQKGVLDLTRDELDALLKELFEKGGKADPPKEKTDEPTKEGGTNPP